MNSATADLIAQLRQIVGAALVLTPAEHDLSAYELDWRKRYRGRALCVVKPSSTAEVAAVVQACAAQATSIVPQGGNTSLVGGAVPNDSASQVLVHMARMNRIVHVDPANHTLTAQAGCTLQQAQTAAAQHQRLLPLSLASEGTCSLGGNLATNAGGTQVLRYGNARDLCLGLEVVTPQGDIWHGLKGLRKDNTGYDLKQLYIGSEGTLGIITAATLKLYPLPACQLTAWVAVPSLSAAVELLNLAQQHLDSSLTAFELMGLPALLLVHQHLPQLKPPIDLSESTTPWLVLLELSGSQLDPTAQLNHLLETASTLKLVTQAVVAHSLQQSQALWHLREATPLAQAQQGLNIKHDISLPISAVADFVRHTDAALHSRYSGIQIINFGHLGDGNLHYNVQAPAHQTAADFLAQNEAAINALVYDAVQAHQGSISAEHGIGQLKRDELALRADPTAMALMRQLKAALDPQHLMNPQRVISCKPTLAPR